MARHQGTGAAAILPVQPKVENWLPEELQMALNFRLMRGADRGQMVDGLQAGASASLSSLFDTVTDFKSVSDRQEEENVPGTLLFGRQTSLISQDAPSHV